MQFFFVDRSSHMDGELKTALNLTRQALDLCDAEGFAFAAIHLCAALEVLEALHKRSTPSDIPNSYAQPSV